MSDPTRDSGAATAWEPCRVTEWCSLQDGHEGDCRYVSAKPAADADAAASRAAPYRSRTGITQDEYDRLLAEQGGHCALCPNTPKTRRLHVDHDHATGRVRGLLCFRCNKFLPSWVTREWALRVAEYVA